MKMFSPILIVAFGCLVVLAGAAAVFPIGEPPTNREALDALMNDGNFKDAYDGYRALALDAEADSADVEISLRQGLACLARLGREDESDEFLEAVIAARKDDHRVIATAAECYLDAVQPYGSIVAGEFVRGRYGQGGESVDSSDRDRARALQLLTGVIEKAQADPDRNRAGRFFMTLSRALSSGREGNEAWRLQTLTPLDELPDYEPRTWMFRGRWGGGGGETFAPVDEDGEPIYYPVPEGFDKAQNDGQRWRWALVQAAEADADQLNTTRLIFARFLLSQFGTQTIEGRPRPLHGDEESDAATSPHALETLKDEETVARLATGVKRFTLPDEFNPIKVFQTIADDPKTGKGEEALQALAGIFENRRQFDRAVEYLKLAKERYGDPNNVYQARLDQILKPWGQFGMNSTQPAGQGATVDFIFRNGDEVSFEAHKILVDKLLADVKAYIKSKPKQLDWQKIDVNEIGARLVRRDEHRYRGESFARWDLKLDPPKNHFDRRINVTTPLQDAGAYLLTARMKGGNIGRIVVWLDDTVVARKPMAGKSYYFVADARSGAPIAGADLELFGWRTRQVDDRREFQIDIKDETHKTDADGQVVAQLPGPNQRAFQWLAVARTAQGRLAYLGFSNIWPVDAQDPVYDQVRVYTMTDRPVYRPGSAVKFKFWVARSRYDQPEGSDFAGQEFDVEIRDPKGDKVHEAKLKADAFGGFDGSFDLPSDATLGVYQAVVVGRGGGSFRVEEYKKPEFEVKVDAPSKPVALGEKITAKVQADYYFGGPVAEAKVKYKVTRTYADEQWFPVAPWDWLYGPGYWWFASDYAWYPGWSTWGTARPAPWWWGRSQPPPEVVAEAEVPIGADGSFEVEIDTAAAKVSHPNRDHRYEIEAEVTDQSRRTIVGNGVVLVARKPFTVYTWVNRGHYREGDVIEAGVRAQTLDRKPVVGEGTLKLLRVTYDDKGQPVETEVESWPLQLDEDGRANQKIKAARAGQYRVSAEVDDGQGHVIEGGYLLTVTGAGFDGASFRFNDLEVIPEKKEYKVGEKVRLLINTNRVGSTVLLFVRPVNGVYLPPRVIRMEGKSAVEEFEVVGRDMPNMFIEALTISSGKIHEEPREIAIPPASQIVDVEVKPSQETYKPGEKAKLDLKLTGPDGEPFQGSTVLTVYDKSVEYISGGSNVGDIKELFWSWKRSHNPRTESSLSRRFHNLLRDREVPMLDLGSLGDSWGPASRAAMARGGAVANFAAAPEEMADAEAAPMPMMAEAAAPGVGGAMRKREAEADKAADMDAPATPADGEEPGGDPAVRSNFADTAFWAAAVEANADGSAEVEFPVPDSLTTWKTRAWTLGAGTEVGQAEAEFITTKDLLVRLQAPRFFVQKDEVVLSAVVHNNLKEEKKVQVVLELDGGTLEPMGETSKTVTIGAGSETRVDWRVKVANEGQAVVRMKALAGADSDAAQMTFPAHVHGMLKMDAVAGTIRPDETEASVTLRVPEERRPEQSRLEVRYSPTLAGALIDALPYLIDYPYGCTEQTLNRFLPVVITHRTLIDLGVDLNVVREKHANLNAQEIGPSRPRFQGRDTNPVFDIDEVVKIARENLQRLADMQLDDGGWGWFSGFGERSSAHTTAQVVHGLRLARQNDLALPENMLERGVEWLKQYQDRQVELLKNGETEAKPYKKRVDEVDALVFMVLTDAGERNDAMLGYLDRDRPGLSVYAKCLYGLALHELGEADKLAAVLKNIEQYVVQDDENQTAYLKLPNQGYWWSWYGSETESDAFYLKLLARTDPKGELAPKLVKYILNNRKRGTYWTSTRDTGYSVEALAEYLKASGEDKPDLTLSIALDGRVRKEVKIDSENLFTFDDSLVIEGEDLDAGDREVTITKKGTGPVYFNAYMTNFTLEDPITRAGLEVKVNRKVYRLIRDDKTVDAAGGRGQAVGQRVERYRREPLPDGATLKSGELVEVELEIESKNDYEYLIFQDYKGAGFEPVEVRSGYNGNDLGAYVEFRDERVVFFVTALSRGRHGVSYRLRAEIPGAFHALPARAEAMYAPELKGNSDEIRLNVVD